MFNTLQAYHFGELPDKIQKKAELMLQDLCPLGVLYEGTIDAVEVWGKDDILTLMRAMYNEAKHENKISITTNTRTTMSRNPKCQFELKTLDNKQLIKEAYDWCIKNLPLKEDKGLQYWADEMFIITSSQKIIDKVNEHFGSRFTFKSEEFWESRVHYL